MQFTFTVADQPLFAHRGPATWLHDLSRFTSLDQSKIVFTDDVLGDHYAVSVEGDEDTLRFACVALNLHAEQAPWDSTPVEQGAALERVIAAGGAATDEDIVPALVAAGLQADYGFTPSRIDITLDRVTQHEEEPTYSVLLTTGHNVDGWEAVVDVEGSQYGLEDGPGVNATTAEVVEWVLALRDSGWAEA